MMNTTVGRGAGAVVVRLVLFAACGSSEPTSKKTNWNKSARSTSAADSADSAETAVIVFLPPLSGPSRTFLFDRELS